MRLFIATSFPEEVKRELQARVTAVKPKLAAASWVRPETQHLTFAFLGEQEQPIVARLGPEVQQRLKSKGPFEARLSGCGFFPNSRRARVGWIGLDPERPFLDVADAVREAVTMSGVELDRAAFKPHLTIMRIRDSWPQACIEAFERALSDYRSAPFVVDKVTLYSSTLTPGGAVHSPLSNFRF